MFRGKGLLAVFLLAAAIPAAGAYVDRETPVVEVVEKWGPSVVNISTEKVISLAQEPFWRGYGSVYDSRMQRFNREQTTLRVKLKSVGSGVIVDERGLIVTNAHVVKMASTVFVTFSDGTRAEGKIRFIRHNDDIALIEVIPPFELTSIEIADEDGMMIGETLIAIGNPFGLENSVTTGVLSGKNRQFYAAELGHVFTGLVQTDAAINMGNSGGALLNLAGELVGINLTVVQNSEGISFAVSSVKIRDILEEFLLVDRFRREREDAIKEAVGFE